MISNSKQALHHHFINRLKGQLAKLNNIVIQLRVIDAENWRPDISSTHQLTIVLGTLAAQKISRHKHTRPVLFSLLPSTTYQSIVTYNKQCLSRQCSAIYIDQPLKRTLELTRLALPRLKTAGLLLSQHNNINIDSLEAVAANHGIEILHQKLLTKENLVFSLDDILQTSDALLSLPDPGIYTSHTAQNILLTAYRHRKPVIGYSQAFVKAGALYAVYSTPAQIAQQTAEVIKQFFSDGQALLPAAQYPRYFSVSINSRVAKSLGIDIDDESTLQERLEAATYE